MERTFTCAPKSKRLGAIIVDAFIVFVFWYLVTKNDLARVDELMKTLDPAASNALDLFSEEVIKMTVAFVFKFVFAVALYHGLTSAILGDGRTLGKLFFRLKAVDAKTLEETTALKLILREVVGRALIETLFVVPYVVSAFIVLFSDEGRTIHDRISGTIVISG